MNVTFFNCVVGLIFIMVSSCDASAGLLEETCDRVYNKLSSGPYERLTKSIEKFTNDDKLYHGCVIRLSGNINKITDTQWPDRLFGDVLPYCPGGKLPPDVPRNKDGWCEDRMADGSDSTSFRVFKNNVFCQVEGSWEGGIVRDPTYVPSPRYSVIVMCGSRK